MSCESNSIISVFAGIFLVADDSPVIRKILRKYLKVCKCNIHICSDGEQAIEWFNEHSAECIAIITDLEMPRMGGDALIAAANAINPDLPCYIISGSNIPAVKLPRGAKRSVLKPISLERVESIVAEVQSLISIRPAHDLV